MIEPHILGNWLIDREFLKKFPTSSFLGTKKITAWMLIMMTGWILLSQMHPLLQIIGIFLVGCMFAHGVELQHQALHGNLFTSRKWNSLWGAILGVPFLVSYNHYRFLHLKHHQNLGTPRDKEFFERDQQNTSLFKGIFLSIFSARYVAFAKNSLASITGTQIAGLNNAPHAIQMAIRRDYVCLGTFLIGISSVGLIVPELGIAIAKYYLIPLLAVTGPVHYLIEFPEHFGCDRRSPSVFKNTRTIKGSAFSFWFTNGNNFHVEHHRYPSAPIDALPKIYREAQLDSYEHHCNSYLTFFQSVFTSPSSSSRLANAHDA